MTVLLGNGDGTFQGQLAFAAPGAPDSMVVADWNGDSLPDLGLVAISESAPEVVVGACTP